MLLARRRGAAVANQAKGIRTGRGAAYVRWLAWLEYKMVDQGYSVTEYEAAWRLTEFRRMGQHYKGLAYENISATGKNAALPHYVPRKSTAALIDRKTPYLK